MLPHSPLYTITNTRFDTKCQNLVDASFYCQFTRLSEPVNTILFIASQHYLEAYLILNQSVTFLIKYQLPM